MFNKGTFNRQGFNRSGDTFILIAATLSGTGNVEAVTAIETTLQASLEGSGGLDFRITDAISAHLTGEGGLHAAYVREIKAESHMSGLGTISVNGNRYTIKHIEFEGDFEPGDKITIDSDRISASKNGVNILEELEGIPFNLQVGVNKITYQDGAETRSVRIIVTRRDRWL